MNLTPNSYYKSQLHGYGTCWIKALENQMLCISAKPCAIFRMAGLITDKGSVKITEHEFNDMFEKIKFELIVLKNT